MKNLFKQNTVIIAIAMITVTALTFAALSLTACDNGTGGGTAPSITTTTMPSGKVGTLYSQTLTASGDTPITWSKESGDLPNGLTLSAAGVISGTPTTEGTFNFTVKATNAAGNNTKELSIVIAPNDTPPDITYTAEQSGGADGTADTTAIVFTFSASVDNLNLTAADITVGEHAAKTADASLTGSGVTRTLAVTVSAAGEATVSIAKSGIEMGTKHVMVHKTGQADPTLTGITAAYSGTAAIYPTTPLDSLKADLTVKAQYSNGDEETLSANEYTLSGALAVGANTVTVTYQGKTTTFNVTVSALTVTFMWNDGSTPYTTAQADQNGKVNEPAAPARTGFILEGWYTEAACTNRWNFSTGTVSAPISLYAKWLEGFYVSNEAEWDAAKTAISGGGDNKTYTIIITADFSTPDITGYDYTFGAVTGLNLTIKGDHTITLTGTGRLLFFSNDHTVVIQDTDLKGNSGNAVHLVEGSNITMKGSASVYNNTSTGGASGIYIRNGTFTMQDDASVYGNLGRVLSNLSSYSFDQVPGGAVRVDSGTFIMKGNAKIYGNRGQYGGGVRNAGTFIMQENASIYGNDAGNPNDADHYYGWGGGVLNTGTFTMEGGTISGNTANGWGGVVGGGGGVYIRSGIFTMKGGTISGNISDDCGGGIFVFGGNFRIAGGTVYGSNANTADANTTDDDYGAALYVRTGGTATYGPNDGTGNNILPHTDGQTAYTDNTIRIVNGVKQ